MEVHCLILDQSRTVARVRCVGEMQTGSHFLPSAVKGQAERKANKDINLCFLLAFHPFFLFAKEDCAEWRV